MEKKHTVPGSCHLSLHARMMGCSRKSRRAVPKNLTEALIADAMDTLNGLHLDRVICDSRVVRYEQNFTRGLGLPEPSAMSQAQVASLHQTVPKRCLETGVFKDV